MMSDMETHMEQIRRACREILAVRPVYAEIMSFYEPVFLAQEAALPHTNIPLWRIPDDILDKKRKAPSLTMVGGFHIDQKSSSQLLENICNIAIASGLSVLKDGARKILECTRAGRLQTEDLFDAVLGKIEDADLCGISADMIMTFGYNSIRPSVLLNARQLSAYLNDDKPSKTGCCPICGTPPGLSMLKNKGERWYVCSFCWHEWLTSKIYCPFCGTTDSKYLHYFLSEAEPEYRIDGCDRCRQYIKTIDLDKTTRTIVPAVEAIATLHLDQKAMDAAS